MTVSFVNRELELELIDEAFKALVDGKSLLRTPIIDFYGVEGIGKTSLLREVERKCHNYNIKYIWANGKQVAPNLFEEITQQIRAKYPAELQDEQEHGSYQIVPAARALLDRGPVVMLLDSVDTTNKEQVQWLETMLRDLIEENTLFVVVSSKRMLTFERERSVARKLTPIHVKPLDRSSCESYLVRFGNQIEPQIRDLIFEWTHGYPLAMDVMANAILRDKLDPRKPQHQQQLLTTIVEQVINQGIFANVSPSEQTWYQSALTLLSMPRRFNLVIMQDMIETFSPDLKLGSSLAYIGLPKRIQEATDVLNWNMQRAGFSVEAPVRNVFLLKQKIEEPRTYEAIHRFLANINKTFAEEVTGSDRVRYLREYLYHSTQTGHAHDLPRIVEQTTQEIIEGSDELLLQFYEEFSQDEDLKEMLGDSVNIVLSHIHRHLAEMSRRSAKESTGAEHLRSLRDFFSHIMDDPENKDPQSELKQSLEDIIREDSPGVSFELFQELSRDGRFKKILGPDFDALFLLIRNKLSEER